jgi:hypothetical protein
MAIRLSDATLHRGFTTTGKAAYTEKSLSVTTLANMFLKDFVCARLWQNALISRSVI